VAVDMEVAAEALEEVAKDINMLVKIIVL